jgi:hypothetical protein
MAKRKWRPSLELLAIADVIASKPVAPTNDNTISSVKYKRVRRGSVKRQAQQIEFLKAVIQPAAAKSAKSTPTCRGHKKLLAALSKRDSVSIRKLPLIGAQPRKKLTDAVDGLKSCELDPASIAKAALRLFLVGTQVTGRCYWEEPSFRALAVGLMVAVREMPEPRCSEHIRKAMSYAVDDEKWFALSAVTITGQKKAILAISPKGIATLSALDIEPAVFSLSRRASKVYTFLKSQMKKGVTCMPTYDDIHAAINMSRNDISAALKELRKKGRLRSS